MKKFLCVLMALCMMLSVAFAEAAPELNWADYEPILEAGGVTGPSAETADGAGGATKIVRVNVFVPQTAVSTFVPSVTGTIARKAPVR